MMIRRAWLPRLGLALAVLLGARSARAGDADAPSETTARRPLVSVSAQDLLLLPGDYDISVADISLQAGSGAGLGLSLETFVVSGLDLGLQALVLRRGSDDLRLADSTFWHFGVHGGPAFELADGMLLSVWGLVGFQLIAFADADTHTTGLGVGAQANLSLRLVSWVWLRGQVGALMQPTGGHAATDVTMPLTPMLGLGFALVAPSSG